MPAGRPTGYNEEIAARICTMLSEGHSLRAVCREEWAPELITVWRWIGKYPEFSNQYDKAKQQGLEALAEDICDIADNGTNDWMQANDPHNEGYKLNGEAVQRAKLRIDARKWILSKLAPKKYGDKVVQEVTGKDGGPVETSLKIEFVKPNEQG